MSSDTINKVTVYRLLDVALDDIDLEAHTRVKKAKRKVADKQVRYRLFFMDSHPRNASWYKVFRSVLESVDHNPPRIQTPGFVLLVEIDESIYAVTGGSSHHALKKAAKIDHKFGVSLAERILYQPEITGLIQRDTSGAVTHLDRAFRGRYNPDGEIDNLKRVLKKVRGKLGKDNSYIEKIGKSIQAGEALTVNGAKDFKELIRFLVQVHEISDLTDTRLKIPQLEHIEEKHNKELLGKLREALVQELADYDEDQSNFYLDNEEVGYLPDHVSSYQLLHTRQKHPEQSTCHSLFEQVGGILSDIEDSSERMDAFNKMRLKVTFDEEYVETVALRKYICGDIVHENEVYFLSNGHWYHASVEFIAKIDDELNEVAFLEANTLDLVEWDESTHKGATGEYLYNKDNRAQGYTLLDRRLVKIPEERGPIEFCDLLRTEDEEALLLHVKKAKGAELRALFAQGAVSARLYSESSTFRENVLQCAFTKSKDSSPQEEKAALANLASLRRNKMTVVYAIFDPTKSHSAPDNPSGTSEALEGTLTVFAKVDLLDRATLLRSMGFNVAVTRIRPYSQKG